MLSQEYGLFGKTEIETDFEMRPNILIRNW